MKRRAPTDLPAVRLSYRDSGVGQGRPVVLLHALGEDSGSWDAVAAALARSRRVLAVDLRGHGRSDWADDYSFELMRDDVVVLLRRLGLADIDLIGHSLGAVVGYLIAEDAASPIRRLVLEEPPPPLPARPPREVPPQSDGAPSFDWRAVGALTAQRNLPDPRWWSGLGDIRAKVLVIAGGPSSHVPQHRLRQLAARIPGARMLTIEAGHDVHENAPSEFLSVVLPFLSD